MGTLGRFNLANNMDDSAGGASFGIDKWEHHYYRYAWFNNI
jgi:hypothetical protein